MVAFKLWTATQRKWVFAITAIVCVYVGYQSVSVLSEPPIHRLAKLSTLQNLFWSDRTRFEDKIKKHFPIDTSQAEFVEAVKSEGFTVTTLPPRVPNTDVQLLAVSKVDSGITRKLSLGVFDIQIYADFEKQQLKQIRGRVVVQSF